jgi:hypothetical protein
MIIKKEKKGGVMVYTVREDMPESEIDKRAAKRLTEDDRKNMFIVDHDADVFLENGEMLIRFRKNKLSKEKVDAFWDNVIQFARKDTANRGTASGSKTKNIKTNPKIKSNIIGYFDTLTPSQKLMLKNAGVKIDMSARETSFIRDCPEKYEKLIPLVKEIDEYYAKYAPDHYAKQRKKADETHFKIKGTSFTTITTNVNFQTSLHKDKGDDRDGFGNLAVIEKGKYSGAETCFPQFGVGVDCRTGDVLFMDVHYWHSNLPMKKLSDDAERLSIVCYLRWRLWEYTRGKTQKQMKEHVAKIHNAAKKTQHASIPRKKTQHAAIPRKKTQPHQRKNTTQKKRGWF